MLLVIKPLSASSGGPSRLAEQAGLRSHALLGHHIDRCAGFNGKHAKGIQWSSGRCIQLCLNGRDK